MRGGAGTSETLFFILNLLKPILFSFKWPDKSSKSYDMLDFKSYIENV